MCREDAPQDSFGSFKLRDSKLHTKNARAGIGASHPHPQATNAIQRHLSCMPSPNLVDMGNNQSTTQPSDGTRDYNLGSKDCSHEATQNLLGLATQLVI